MSFILVHHDCSVWFEFKPIRTRNRSHLPAVCTYSVCMFVCVWLVVSVCVCVQSVAVFCINTAALILTHTNTPRSHLPLSALAVIICQRWQPPLFNRRRSACHSSRRVPNHPRAGNLRLCWRWLISPVLSTPPLDSPTQPISEIDCFCLVIGVVQVRLTCARRIRALRMWRRGGSPVRVQRRRRCLLKHAWWPAWNVDDE